MLILVRRIKTQRLGKTRLLVGEKTILVLYKHRNNNNNKHLLISVSSNPNFFI